MRAYNASYNYFAGMTDDGGRGLPEGCGDRPPPDLGHGRQPGRQGAGRASRPRRQREWDYLDPLGVLKGENFQRRPRRASGAAEPKRPRYSGPVRRALDVLGLDETATGCDQGAYKALVKRFHPDANGGDRSFEERLRDIIKAHDTLKTAGLC